MKVFTAKDLARCNGRNGKPVYVAYKGKVYDVSTSFLWKDGTHQVLHIAGTDLTHEIEEAPHSGDLLGRFPIVGTLREADLRNV
jgi:predicted heme/steroid binding protein